MPLNLRGVQDFWLCFNALVLTLASSHIPRTLYLNSVDYCGGSGGDATQLPITINENEFYKIKNEKPDTVQNAQTGYSVCKIVLRSFKTDGRLCVLNQNPRPTECGSRIRFFEFNDWNVNTEMVRPSHTIDCDISPTSVEWCTTKRHLSVTLSSTTNRSLIFDYLVYDMSNKNRQAYMDSVPYCGSTFQLDSSQLTVTNMDPDAKRTLFQVCSLTFEYVGHNENTSLCIIFEPINKTCSVPYTLNVIENGNTLTKKMYAFTCQDVGTWNSSSRKLTLTLFRNMSVPETDIYFRLSIQDQVGECKSFNFPDLGKSTLHMKKYRYKDASGCKSEKDFNSLKTAKQPDKVFTMYLL